MLSRWLRYQGKAGIALINQLNQVVIATTLQLSQVTEVTLDIDATVIATKKASATSTYQKQPGYILMVGTLVETGQVIAVELRHGCVSPKTDHVGFIKTCQELLASGVRRKCVRIDAAGYQHQVIDYLECHGIEFVIRGATNDLIMTDIATLSEPAWQPLRSRDGSLSTDEWVARCTHTMYRSTRTFDFVVQRTRLHPVVKMKQAAQLRKRKKVDGSYEYQMIATHIKGNYILKYADGAVEKVFHMS